MKKKIIFVCFCLMLFLIFTALSYGGPDPKYRLREHPWDHMLSPGLPGDTTVEVEVSVFLIAFKFNTPMVISIAKELSSNKVTSNPSSISHKKK